MILKLHTWYCTVDGGKTYTELPNPAPDYLKADPRARLEADRPPLGCRADLGAGRRC